ncbi:MAG TPA: hypothetical protein VGN23_02370 [Verrucomicrobiae bacterium]|jgi:ABC-type amino acid transport substrate-binding protein|nr:hypothetical protein [Verrucomicrobiae bacterium]
MKTSMRFMIFLAVGGLFAGAALSLSADQVTLQNGDMLNGRVLSVTTNSLVLRDETLGTLTLPRTKVSKITFGVLAAAQPPLAMANTLAAQAKNSALNQPAEAGTPSTPSYLQSMFREVREHSNLVQEVEAQVLGASASPEAVNKFNDLLDQLSSGQLDMNGLRSQAQSAADQLQEFKKEMGPDAGEEVDGYLAILNHFLRETSSTNGVSP